MNAAVSIIIPARNDAKALRLTLDHLERLPGIETAEIIVAASGDTEETEAVVGGRARILWPAGSTRSALMNAGAAVARGNVFFFLHADSFPPVNGLVEMQQVLRDEAVIGGAFEHQFREPVLSLAVISRVNRMRYRLTRNFYGDQGIFVRADVFRSISGFRELFMEDLDLSQRLKRLGRMVLIPIPLTTSGRRFLSCGPFRTFSFVLWLLFLHSLRLDTQRYAARWLMDGMSSLKTSGVE